MAKKSSSKGKAKPAMKIPREKEMATPEMKKMHKKMMGKAKSGEECM